MGQAFDREGEVLGEVVGNSKRQVFDELMKDHPNAAELRIRARGEEPLNLPRYRCHKEVRAARIVHIETGPERAKLTLDGPRAPKVIVEADYLRKHSPRVGGYFVMYTDGYCSFSPSEAFEGGYTLIDS